MMTSSSEVFNSSDCCFLCSTPIISDDDRRTQRRLKIRKGGGQSSVSILVNYLINSKHGNDGRDDNANVAYLVKQVIKNRPNFCQQFCCRCWEAAEKVRGLQEELEVIQMKIVHVLKKVRQGVASNSKGKQTQPSTQEGLENGEDGCLEGMEMDKLQSLIRDNAQNIMSITIPLVYLGKRVIFEDRGGNAEGLDDNNGVDPDELLETVWDSDGEPSAKRRKTGASKTSAIHRGHRSKAQLLATKIRKEKKLKIGMRQARSSNTFTCEQCPFTSNLFGKLEQHLEEHETPEKRHRCPECREGFTTRQLYEMHLTRYCGAKSTPCTLCGDLVAPTRMREHLETKHKSNEIFSCLFCRNVFGTYTALIYHYVTHRDDKLSCDDCPGLPPFKKRTDLIQHLYECHGWTGLLLKCEVAGCSRTFFHPGCWIKHRKVHAPTKNLPYGCDQCSRHFADKRLLARHKVKEHNLPRFVCDLCPNHKGYVDASGLVKHNNVHHGVGDIKMFQCDQCGRQFQNRDSWKYHVSTHIDRKDYTCEICGFATRMAGTLKLHMERHNPEKKYECPECQKRFTMKHILAEHLRTHSDQRPFQCEQCGQGFKSKKYLRRHLKTGHIRQRRQKEAIVPNDATKLEIEWCDGKV